MHTVRKLVSHAVPYRITGHSHLLVADVCDRSRLHEEVSHNARREAGEAFRLSTTSKW